MMTNCNEHMGDKQETYCVNCENYISSLCLGCWVKTDGIPSKYCKIGETPKQSNFAAIKAMNIDQLAEWLNKHLAFDDAPYMVWFDEKYCNNCEPIMCKYPDSSIEFPCAYCELEQTCKFFPEQEDVPDSQKIIKMWLEAEVEE